MKWLSFRILFVPCSACVTVFAVAPSAPSLQASAVGTSWIRLEWASVVNGGSAVRGYMLNFRREASGEWEERALPRDALSYALRNLTCGTEYQLQLFAFNAIGSGAPSDLLVTRTDGFRPLKPSYADFVATNVSTIALNIKAWHDNGCPITSFTIEYRDNAQEDWITGIE